jgi:hypothetical protein
MLCSHATVFLFAQSYNSLSSDPLSFGQSTAQPAMSSIPPTGVVRLHRAALQSVLSFLPFTELAAAMRTHSDWMRAAGTMRSIQAHVALLRHNQVAALLSSLCAAMSKHWAALRPTIMPVHLTMG